MHRSLAIVLLVSACASGGVAGQEGKMDAPAQQRDGSFVTNDAPKPPPDARPPDAHAPPDAAVDAASGLFCSDNSQCTTAGQCCLTLGGPTGFCAPGTVVLGVCVPQ